MLEGNRWFPSIFELVVIVMIAIVGSLVSRLVGIVIVIFFEVALLGVVKIVLLVVLAIAHSRLIVLVF
jgi:hypothetical protein